MPRPPTSRSRTIRGSSGASATRSPDLRPQGASRNWLELSVEADLEAVEAGSEILSRVAPGGTSVEPAVELIAEGLGARSDPRRPATGRAAGPARAPRRRSPGAAAA